MSESKHGHVEDGATEVLYTIHPDATGSRSSTTSFEADVSGAVRQFERSYLGVRVERRASIVEGSNCAVALMVSGGFASEHLDAIWFEQLARFGLAARRASADAELKASAS